MYGDQALLSLTAREGGGVTARIVLPVRIAVPGNDSQDRLLQISNH